MSTRWQEGFGDGVDWARDVVDTVRDKYPEDVFPDDGESMDAASASMARRVCEEILRDLEEGEQRACERFRGYDLVEGAE